MKVPTFVVSFAILSAALVWASPPADKPVKHPSDAGLAQAIKDPQIYLFSEQATSKTKADSGFDLVITSARGLNGARENVLVRPGTMRIFRADSSVDDFTKHGGWYWRCGDQKGKTQFKEPGALIMVVRQQDGTVFWYSLAPDFRC